jgi:hypothetical protein
MGGFFMPVDEGRCLVISGQKIGATIGPRFLGDELSIFTA